MRIAAPLLPTKLIERKKKEGKGGKRSGRQGGAAAKMRDETAQRAQFEMPPCAGGEEINYISITGPAVFLDGGAFCRGAFGAICIFCFAFLLWFKCSP